MYPKERIDVQTQHNSCDIRMKEVGVRIIIDEQLRNAGWRLPGDSNPNVQAGQGIVSETNLEADYVLEDDNSYPLAVLEAKRSDIEPLSAKEQARKYAEELKAPFVILSNGTKHYIWKIKLSDPEVIAYLPTVEELVKWRDNVSEQKQFISETITENYILDAQGRNCPPEKRKKLRDYQIEAVQAVQQAATDGSTRFLLEMATGTGKTLVAGAAIKMFLTTAKAHRVLFIVDRIELERQAKNNFDLYFSGTWHSVIYKKHKDDWNRAHVLITTVQSLTTNNRYREFSRRDFGLVIVDEAHRAIGGNRARHVFDYFSAYKLGLTATPKDYLQGVCLSGTSEKEKEARQLRDTYSTFGCEPGKPTYHYDLERGASEKNLIKPRIIDARTEKTTKLLSEKGWSFVATDDESGELKMHKFFRKHYERKLFSEATNKAMCHAFLSNALLDPISGDIGKTIIYCISQKHAAKIAHVLNKLASELFPGKYESDFALQVTSQVEHAQEYAEQFSNNNLKGKTKSLDDYGSCKTRVCVTVGMMTTGYDCPDILNVCFMRPIFSPSEFIQIRGRGTRRHSFKYEGVTEEKKTFKLFDFFAVCEYFEKDHNYDTKLRLTLDGETGEPRFVDPDKTGVVVYEGDDRLDTLREIDSPWSMPIDHETITKESEAVLLADQELRRVVELGELDAAVKICREKYADKLPALEKLAAAHGFKVERKVSIGEVLELLFGKEIELKDRDILLKEETANFCAGFECGEDEKVAAAEVFKACLHNPKIFKIYKDGRFAELAVWQELSQEVCEEISRETRGKIIDYIENKSNQDIFDFKIVA